MHETYEERMRRQKEYHRMRWEQLRESALAQMGFDVEMLKALRERIRKERR
jgi:5,10-methylenetetrahydrofolate reductase